MNFTSSRLAAAAALVVIPLVHSVACGGSTELNFVGGDSGTSGGNSSVGGNSSGGSSSLGGSSSGGASATGGSGAGGSGTGGSATGGSSTGGSSTGGSGTGGSGGDPNCEPTGDEVCDDGQDNDCDGFVDCAPQLVSAFPERGKAAAGAHVQLEFAAPPFAKATFECRTARPPELADAPWGACTLMLDGKTVTPISSDDSQDPTKDGLKTTLVRFSYPDGGKSEAFRHTYYTHHDLHGVAKCKPVAGDETYFKVAEEILPTAGKFGAGAKVNNPFIGLAFDPPANADLDVGDADGAVTALSLRKRFVVNPTDEYVLMTRVYQSKTHGGCHAATVRLHLLPSHADNQCDALVFNKAGAGLCLMENGGNISVPKHNTNYFFAPTYVPTADNLLWRKLGMPNVSSGRERRYFSPKCWTNPGCVEAYDAEDDAIYLPDQPLFVE